jgi:Na+-driven multidrug efflux pump
MLAYVRLCIRAWDWRLYLYILLFLGLPSVYQLYRVYLIGNEIPDPGSLAIVSQWQFVGLVIEVFQEATVLAIFFFVGSQIRSGVSVQLDRIKSVLTFIFVGSLVFSAGVFLFRDAFITLIGTSDEIQAQTRSFLGISIFSVPFTMLAAATIVLLEALNLRRLVLVMAIANVGLRFALDSFFFGGHSFSLDAEILGVGWSTLLASVAIFVVGFGLLVRTKQIPVSSLATRPSFNDMRQYVRVGIGSGVDSLVRNLAYFFMIIRIVNTIGATEIGGYYIAIQILWSFMLVPVLAFADSAKALVANASGDLQRIRTLWHASMVVTAGIMIIWIAAVPAFRSVAGILTDDPETIEWAAIAFGILFVPYVLFSFNTVMDSVFYGTGKTQYLAYQAVLTNGTVYAIAFLLYVTGVWEVTFEGVMVLFSLGILLDTMLTVLFLLKILYLDQSSGTNAAVHTQARRTETEDLSKG